MIDSHCHLDREPLINNLDSVLKRSKDVGIEKLLTICTSLENFDKILKLVEKDNIIFGSFGIHPHEAQGSDISSKFIVEKVKNNKKIIGIGETGLDFFYNNSKKDDQIKSFKIHIEASIELNIPLIVHSRNAEKETFEILNSYKEYKPKILMHCFTGSPEFAQNLFNLGAYFSASGIITFKNSTKLQDTFKIIPINQLLIETDSPFLAPFPNRGKQNEPSFIKYIAKKLSELKNLEESILIKHTTNNFNRLFKN
ncbi:MAG: hydrolase TatD [Candidatus Pelagibacter sp. TMED273]|nr:MAG: hydrolase TatD [Candidatus Pelagibacter sp. TMED273]